MRAPIRIAASYLKTQAKKKNPIEIIIIMPMISCDVFIVKQLPTTTMTFIELGQHLDTRAPMPWLGFCPQGEVMAAFGVDVHRLPEEVCMRLGFNYYHVEYITVEEETYVARNRIDFGSEPYGWMRLFLVAWWVSPVLSN